MGLFDTIWIKEDIFLFPADFCEKNKDFPLSDKKTNLLLSDQTKEFKIYSKELTDFDLKLNDKLGYPLQIGLHEFLFEKDSDGVLKLFFRDRNTKKTEPSNPLVLLDFLDIEFEVFYIQNCEDIHEYRVLPHTSTFESDKKRNLDLMDQYGNYYLNIKVIKGIVEETTLRDYYPKREVICELDII